MARGEGEEDDLEAYIRRHEADRYAHAPMRHDLRSDLTGQMGLLTLELDKQHDNWQQLIGVVKFVALMVGGGVAAAVIELWRLSIPSGH